jgi:NAD(P)-dependent dehydrogenase (short-subunit alcohol dehydrogenase family)
MPEALRFDGQVAIVTGAGGGLGRAHARMLAERGCRVVVNDAGVVVAGASAPTAAAVVAEIAAAGGTAVADDHDVVTDGAAIVERAVEAFGRVDIVINNAGVASGGPIGPDATASWATTIATTLTGSIAVTGAAWPHLVAAGGGRVVLTASQAMFGAAGSGAYSAAKSSMFGLARSLAEEGRRHGIAVNAIMPTAWTRLTQLLPAGPITELLAERYPVEAVASFVVWLCHAEAPVSGEMFSVGGGRAGRVVLAENRGGRIVDLDPASWSSVLPDLLDLEADGLAVPRSMVHEVSWQAANLAGAVPEAYRPGGTLAWE